MDCCDFANLFEVVDSMSGACDTKPFPKAGDKIAQNPGIFDSAVVPTAPSTITSSSATTSATSSSTVSSTTLTSSSSSSHVSSSTSSISATTPTGSSDKDAPAKTETNHLSTGAVLAIGLTVGLGGIALIVGLAVYFLLRNRKKRDQPQPPGDAIALFEKPRSRGEPSPIYSEMDPQDYPVEYPPSSAKFAQTEIKGLHEAGTDRDHPRFELAAHPMR